MRPFQQNDAVRHRRAFTLIELLVVISIMLVLLAVVAPVASNPVTSGRVNEAVNLLTEELEVARMKAKVIGREVEVRFYQFDDSSGGGIEWRGFQIIAYEVVTDPGDPGYRTPGSEFLPNESQLSGLITLPEGIVFATSPAGVSTLLTDTSRSPATGTPAPQVVAPPAATASVTRFRFLPDGSTDLNISSGWCITLTEQVKMIAAGGLPANYATLQIDPHNGELRWFRP